MVALKAAEVALRFRFQHTADLYSVGTQLNGVSACGINIVESIQDMYVQMNNFLVQFKLVK